MTRQDLKTLQDFASGPVNCYDVHFAQLALRKLLADYAYACRELEKAQLQLADTAGQTRLLKLELEGLLGSLTAAAQAAIL